jgi:hypothetical protein
MPASRATAFSKPSGEFQTLTLTLSASPRVGRVEAARVCGAVPAAVAALVASERGARRARVAVNLQPRAADSEERLSERQPLIVEL